MSVAYAFHGTETVCGVCRSSMTAMLGTRIVEGRPRRILWWQCQHDPDHVTASVPLPPDPSLLYAPQARGVGMLR